jgi:hypothetical protein
MQRFAQPFSNLRSYLGHMTLDQQFHIEPIQLTPNWYGYICIFYIEEE